MKKKVLITNLQSYIGAKYSASISNKSCEYYAFYPEGDDPQKYATINSRIILIPLNLSNTQTLKKHFQMNDYDTIIHIPDFHSNHNKSRKYLRIANVFSTQQVIEYCLKAGSKLIYCSSVVIYGNSPFELPSNDLSEKIIFGHRTKMIAEIESLIERNRLKGLKAVILRPAIIYGKEARGFFITLMKLIKYRLLPKINDRIYIHLCDINLLTSIISKAIYAENIYGKNYNVADKEPVILKDLIDYVSNQISRKDYKTILQVNLYIGRNIANLFYRLNWVFGGNFMERLTHNWFYDIEDLERDFSIPLTDTFSSISKMLDK